MKPSESSVPPPTPSPANAEAGGGCAGLGGGSAADDSRSSSLERIVRRCGIWLAAPKSVKWSRNDGFCNDLREYLWLLFWRLPRVRCRLLYFRFRLKLRDLIAKFNQMRLDNGWCAFAGNKTVYGVDDGDDGHDVDLVDFGIGEPEAEEGARATPNDPKLTHQAAAAQVGCSALVEDAKRVR